MRTYKHSIAKSKLEKKGLSSKQISKVYSYKSKSSQVKATQRFIAANKSAKRFSAFWLTGLGQYTLNKGITRIENIRYSKQWDTLSEKRKKELQKRNYQLTQILLWTQSKLKRTEQEKIDAKLARLNRQRMWKSHMNAKEDIYRIESSEFSYKKNKTTNVGLEEYIKSHYWNEFQELVDGKKDKDGNWIKEPISEQESINKLLDLAIEEGKLQILEQGANYGYITDDYKEIISPI